MTSERYEPFPLTDTQRAYLIGRGDFYPLGNVSTHAYLEYRCVIDPDRFATAWARVVDRHDMLRAVVDPQTATQRILPGVPDSGLALRDLRGLDEPAATAQLTAIRDTMAHEVRAPGEYPIFGMALSLLSDTGTGHEVRARLHVGIDGLTLDYASWHVLLRDLSIYYDDPAASPPPLTCSFREYVLAAQDLADPEDIAEANEYWNRVLPDLPGPPHLPLRREPESVTHPRFDRLDDCLDASTWARLQASATAHGLTASGLMIAAFAQVVAHWSGTPRFTLNIPRMGRDELLDGVGDVAGEFATFTLLDIDASQREPFAEFAFRAQRRMWEALEHGVISGTELLRRLGELHGTEHGPVLMPVVLTSTLAFSKGDSALVRSLEPVYHITSTPQVYLDVQLEEQLGELYINWDYVRDVLRPGVIEAMFAAWSALLRNLANDETLWGSSDPIGFDTALARIGQDGGGDSGGRAFPIDMPVRRDSESAGLGVASVQSEKNSREDDSNGVGSILPVDEEARSDPAERQAMPCFEPEPYLNSSVQQNISYHVSDSDLAHNDFLNQVRLRPDAPAVRGADGREFSYARLYATVSDIAWWLREHSPELEVPEPIVAIVMAKSPEQIGAAIGVLCAGMAYLPIDPEQPTSSIARLLERARPVAVLTDTVTARVLPDSTPVTVAVDRLTSQPRQGLPDTATTAHSLAYLLPTSGSTGQPKLVAVEHGGVVNCLRATAHTFEIGPRDRSLALTALHHDMSLFDVFGVLGAGGCVIVPDAARRTDPQHWLTLMSEHGVTLWNSVPAMMRMLLDYHRENTSADLGSVPLRLSFLGGDWFPLELAADYRAVFATADLVSVGGPTETTLWNIWHRVGDLAEYRDWISVPYGTPIPGARYHLLDDRGFECPDWVIGEMCCSGIGVAREYLGDPELTAQRFVRHPVTGARLYRTGDLGRRRPGGTLEFIGRRDSQVQLRGRRVEPSAVEAALRSHPDVRHAVVTAVAQTTGPGHRALVAHVVADAEEATLRAYLHDRIAGYLVPSRILVLETLPLTPGGKVDRAKLTIRGEDSLSESPATTPDDTEESALTTVIATAWADALGLERVGMHDNFFALGGDSLSATRILARLRRELAGCEISARAVLAGIDVATCARELLAHAGPAIEEAARRTLDSEPASTRSLPLSEDSAAPDSGPLSAAQRRMWFAERLSPGSAANHLAVTIRLDDALRPDDLCAALADVVARHTILRTVYRTDSNGVPAQHILPSQSEHIPRPTRAGAPTGLATDADNTPTTRSRIRAAEHVDTARPDNPARTSHTKTGPTQPPEDTRADTPAGHSRTEPARLPRATRTDNPGRTTRTETGRARPLETPRTNDPDRVNHTRTEPTRLSQATRTDDPSRTTRTKTGPTQPLEESRTSAPGRADDARTESVRLFQVARADDPDPVARARAEAVRPFDLRSELPIRAGLIRDATAGGWVLWIVLHHIAFDNNCWDILFGDLSAVYRARRDGESVDDRPVGRYLDYAAAEDDRSRRADHGAARDYWRSRPLHARPGSTLPPRGGRRSARELTGSDRATLTDAARAQGISETTMLMAAAAVTIARRTGRSTITLAVPVIDRGEPGTESVLGNFGNLVLVDIDLDAADLLAEVAARSIEAYAHQQVPFDVVVADQRADRPGESGPLFDAVFSARGELAAELALDGVRTTLTPIELDTARFDLVLESVDTDGGRRLGAVADRDRYTAEDLAALVAEFHTALLGLCSAGAPAPHTPSLSDPLFTARKDVQMTDTSEFEDLSEGPDVDAIAVIGMDGRFPGAPNLTAFWDNLIHGREGAQEFTLDQFLAAGGTEAEYADPALVRVASTVEGIDLFDADFFGYRPSEAELIDPQQRLFLECCHQALQQSGQLPGRFDGRIGVYAGSSQSRYFLENVYPHVMDQANSMASLPATSGSSPGGIATRVAYKLGLTGPAMSVQTACSTSLVAIHVACQDLLNYQCDVALAGGASLNPNPHQGYQAITDGPLSPDGRCRAFDAGANGMFPGDGVGVVVLKRLADALADGDPVRAVIKGSAVNNDGDRKAGYGAPSAPGQVEVILAAQAAAGTAPEEIGYVEAHGTGTPVGDPIELRALDDAFRTGTDRTGYCLLGSVKTNLGHLDAAAGVAGFIKTVLALENRSIPPSLHYSAPNPLFDLDASPFRVVTDVTEWHESLPELAAVSSFGIGGTNAHLILGPAPHPEPPAQDGETAGFPEVLTLSARTPEALAQATEQLAAHLAAHPELPLADIAHTLRIAREEYEFRTAVAVSTTSEAPGALAGAVPAHARADRPVVLVLPGGGTAYPRMSLGLYTSEPAFRAVIDAAAAAAEPLTGVDLAAHLNDPEGFAESGDSAVAFAAIVATEVGLAATLARYGVTPTALIGHSLGEYAAACIAGVLSLEDTIRVVIERARLLDRAGGAATSVLLSPDELAEYLTANLGIATINGPLHTTVSGPVDEIAALETVLEAKGVDVNRLPLPAVHSALLDPELPALAKVLATVTLSEPRIPVISNVSGTWLTAAEATDPGYWLRHTRETVRFADGIDTLVRKYSPLFVEAGPGRGLTRLIELQAGKDAVAPPAMRHRRDENPDRIVLLQALGGIWAGGGAVDLTLTGSPAARKVTLPGYAYQRRRFWIDPPARSGPRRFDLFGYLDRREAELRRQIPVEHVEQSLDSRLEALCALYVTRFLRELGCATEPGAIIDPAAIATQQKFVAPYKRFFDALLSLLPADGYAVREGDRLRMTEKPCGEGELDRERATLLTRHPDAEEELAFLDYCSARYRQVCTGEIAGTEVMFANGSDDRSTDVVDKRLAHSDVAIYTRLVGSALRELAAGRERPLRILEIGAGQGYLTWVAAEAVHGTPVEYTFTDLGRSFVVAAQRKAQQQGYDWMRFGVLDVTSDAAAQGFTEPFDVVLAFNVLHATPDLATTVSKVHSLLTPGGSLLLLESAQQRRVSMLTAGLFEGWWYFTDSLRTHSPLVSPKQWAELLRGAGFADVRVQADVDAHEGPMPVDHALIVGTRAHTGTSDAPQEPASPGRGMFGGGSAFNARPNLSVPYREPDGPLQSHIAQAWQAVLGIDKVGADDDFFDLGGESLLAMQLVTSLRKELGVSLSVKQFFSSGDLTVTGLAGLVEQARSDDGTARSADVIVPSARRAVRS